METPNVNYVITFTQPYDLGATRPLQTPNSSLPPFDPAKPRREINVTISVPEDWENRLDMQWCLEREIIADRWYWTWKE